MVEVELSLGVHGKGGRKVGVVEGEYLLFGVGSCTRPLSNDILAGLIVGRKGEGDSGEGGSKIDSDDKLGFTPAGAFDLHCGVAHVLGLGHSGSHPTVRCHGLLHAVAGRRAHGLRVGLILHIGVQGRGLVGEVLTGRKGAGGPGGVVGVTGGSAQLVVVHRETGAGRRTVTRGRGTDRGGGRRTRRRDKCAGGGIGGRRRRRGSRRSGLLNVVFGSRPEGEGLKPRAHQVHVRPEKEVDRREERDERREEMTVNKGG